MYALQGLPAVFSSVLASSVIIVAARSGLLPPCVVPPLGLCLHVPELLSDALFFGRFMLGLFLALDLPLPCGQVAVGSQNCRKRNYAVLHGQTSYPG